MKPTSILSLTTGDVDGIGYEVAVKALIKKRLPKNYRMVIWRSPKVIQKYTRLLKKSYAVDEFSKVQDALIFLKTNKKVNLVEIVSQDNPSFWVEQSAQLCLKKELSALITGPLSKTTIYDAGLKDMGHTGILSRVAHTNSVFMTFLGKHFNVLCVTGHLPLKEVEKQLTEKKILKAIDLAFFLRQSLPKPLSMRPLGILGLNPHASEQGLIGDFDLRLKKIISAHSHLKDIEGPLVPDAAFLKPNWNKYSLFISLYHDQGLIPFKIIHGQNSGAHYSLGLPFIRTSVDHGTAKDIYKKDMANCNSMLDAIRWATKLTNLPFEKQLCN